MEKQMTIEGLADMISRTMASKEDLKGLATKEDLNIGLKNLEQRMNGRFDHVDARLDTIEHDISDLPEIRQELVTIDKRLTKVEDKIAHA